MALKETIGVASCLLLAACQPPTAPPPGTAASPTAAASEVRPETEAIVRRVVGVIAREAGVEEARVTMDAEFVVDLDADSLDVVEIVMALEDEFGVEIKDTDAERIRTARAAVAYLMAHLSPNAPPRIRPVGQRP